MVAGATIGCCIGILEPDWPRSYNHLFREIQTIQGKQPRMACGTGGLAKWFDYPSTSDIKSRLRKELLSEGWQESRDRDGYPVFRRTFGWILPAKGYASMRLTKMGELKRFTSASTSSVWTYLRVKGSPTLLNTT
jgi:hypothetical protein